MKKEQFNFSALIMMIMQEVRLRAKPTLLYRKFFILVFRDFSIDMEGESFKELKYYDTYNEKSLGRMSYKKIDKEWIKVDEEEEPIPMPKPMPHSADPSIWPVPPMPIRLKEDQIEDIVLHIVDRMSNCISSLMENTVERVLARQHSFVS